MYLHIGNGQTVEKKEIIGIFDMDTATVSSDTKRFLAGAEQSKEIFFDEGDLPKSFLVCAGTEKKQTVFLSKLSAKTLEARGKTLLFSFEEGN